MQVVQVKVPDPRRELREPVQVGDCRPPVEAVHPVGAEGFQPGTVAAIGPTVLDLRGDGPGIGAYLGEDGLQNGIDAKIASWRRIGNNTIPATAKAGGQYLNSILAKIETHKAGYAEAILLNDQGMVADGSGENIFIVKNGVISTPPLSASILEGITRDSIMEIAAAEGYPVVERDLARAELYNADEVFVTGTAAEVCPIRSVDDHVIGPPGPITKRVQHVFEDAVHGRDARWAHWLDYVTAPTPAA